MSMKRLDTKDGLLGVATVINSIGSMRDYWLIVILLLLLVVLIRRRRKVLIQCWLCWIATY